jgi:hypothetical protein
MMPQLIEPKQCALWDRPELIGRPPAQIFEHVKRLVEESHLLRDVLRCRECGQLYFFEFYEWIDWESGNDPQYSTYIPVQGDADVAALNEVEPLGLMQFTPRLERNFPRDAERPAVRWVR